MHLFATVSALHLGMCARNSITIHTRLLALALPFRNLRQELSPGGSSSGMRNGVIFRSNESRRGGAAGKLMSGTGGAAGTTISNQNVAEKTITVRGAVWATRGNVKSGLWEPVFRHTFGANEPHRLRKRQSWTLTWERLSGKGASFSPSASFSWEYSYTSGDASFSRGPSRVFQGDACRWLLFR